MTAIFGGQKEGAGLAPWLVRKLRFSERLIVVGIGWIGIFEAVLLPIQLDELQLIMRADPVAQVIEELDDGLSRFCCKLSGVGGIADPGWECRSMRRGW